MRLLQPCSKPILKVVLLIGRADLLNQRTLCNCLDAAVKDDKRGHRQPQRCSNRFGQVVRRVATMHVLRGRSNRRTNDKSLFLTSMLLLLFDICKGGM